MAISAQDFAALFGTNTNIQATPAASINAHEDFGQYLRAAGLSNTFTYMPGNTNYVRIAVGDGLMIDAKRTMDGVHVSSTFTSFLDPFNAVEWVYVPEGDSRADAVLSALRDMAATRTPATETPARRLVSAA